MKELPPWRRKIPLKPLGKGGSYPANRCAAARCSNESALIDGTHSISKHDLPLCDVHYEKSCVEIVYEIEEHVLRVRAFKSKTDGLIKVKVLNGSGSFKKLFPMDIRIKAKLNGRKLAYFKARYNKTTATLTLGDETTKEDWKA